MGITENNDRNYKAEDHKVNFTLETEYREANFLTLYRLKAALLMLPQDRDIFSEMKLCEVCYEKAFKWFNDNIIKLMVTHGISDEMLRMDARDVIKATLMERLFHEFGYGVSQILHDKYKNNEENFDA